MINKMFDNDRYERLLKLLEVTLSNGGHACASEA